MNDPKNELLDLVARKMSQTVDWRLQLAGKYRSDHRNGLAAQRLADMSSELAVPADAWEALAPHFNRTDEKFAETISLTNRGVGFRHDQVDQAAYWRSLIANVRTAFGVN